MGATVTVLPPAETVVFDEHTMGHLRERRVMCKYVRATTSGRSIDYYIIELPGEQCAYQLIGPRFRDGKAYYVGVRRA
jgi:hypothetical protein